MQSKVIPVEDYFKPVEVHLRFDRREELIAFLSLCQGFSSSLVTKSIHEHSSYDHLINPEDISNMIDGMLSQKDYVKLEEHIE